MSRARWLAAVACASVMVAGCGGATPVTGDAGQPLPAPVSSISPAVAATVARITQVLGYRGLQAFPPIAPYRPSEPASMTQTPRVVLQVAGPDADQGYIVIYDLPTSTAATSAGTELARYLASGFGQTNYPTDTQFYVAQLGSTVVFTWYSASRASDPAAIRNAVDAIQTVGQPFPVIK